MIVRQKLKENFTIISNKIIRDKNLSLQSKMLAVLLASLPKDWVVNTKWLATELNISVRAAQYALRELIDANYIIKLQHQNKDGKYDKGWTIIFVKNEENELYEPLETSENLEQESELNKSDENIENKAFENKAVVKMGDLSEVSGSKETKNGLSNLAQNPRLREPCVHIKEKRFLQSKNLYLMRNLGNSLLFVFDYGVMKKELDYKNLSEGEKEKLKEWFEYKRKQGQGLKLVSKQKLIDKCLKFKMQNESVMAIIDRAIENGWQGLWSFKKQGKKYPNTRLGKQMEEKALIRAVLEQEPSFNGSEDYDLSRVRINGRGVKWLKKENKFILVSA